MVKKVMQRIDIEGWEALDPIILAVLAMNGNALLVGFHGAAKSLIISRLGELLGKETQCILAPNLSIDDLTGVPWVAENEQELKFLTAGKAGIWRVQFLLIDEPNRAAPLTMGKLHSILHERRLLGIDLDNLEVIFAAINPLTDDDATDDMGLLFPLSAPMLDRFYFFLQTPTLFELSEEELRRILQKTLTSKTAKRKPSGAWLRTLIKNVRTLIKEVQSSHAEFLTDYLIFFSALLHERAKVTITTRRINLLAESHIWLHSARLALGEDDNLRETCRIAARNCLPHVATEHPPEPTAVLAASEEAYRVASLAQDDRFRQVLAETDPTERVRLAMSLKLNGDALAEFVTGALSSDILPPQRDALALALWIRLHQGENLPATAFELLADTVRPYLTPGSRSFFAQDSELFDEQVRLLDAATSVGDPLSYALGHNFMLTHLDAIRNNVIPSDLIANEIARMSAS